MPALVLLIALLTPAVLGASQRSAVLPWSEIGLEPARQEAPAQGPEHISAGPDGLLALYDSVRREVLLLQDGAPLLSFPVRHASDLLLTARGVLLLDGAARELQLWSLQGAPLGSQALPALAPSGVTLALEGDQVYAADIFANRHPVATLLQGDLGAPAQGGLREPAQDVRWEDGVMRSEDLRIPLPQAIKASGQRFGDWLIVDAVVAEAPLKLTRQAWHAPTGQSVELPVEGRLYAPRGDAAATPEGELVLLVPRAEGLELLWVTP